MPSARGVAWAGFGHYLPEKQVTNAEIERDMGLPDDWIESRTGIRTRHYAATDQALSDLAVPAGAMALEGAGATTEEVGLLLLATSTPDHLLPPTAPLVAHRLGLSCGAVDLAGACAGFLHALTLGAGHVKLTGKSVLVIAANLLSRRIDPDEVASRVLFADAAGAVLLRPSDNSARGPRAVVLRSDGADYDHIRIERGGSRLPFTAPGTGGLTMRMPDGRAVFARAVEGMVGSAREALAEAGLKPPTSPPGCRIRPIAASSRRWGRRSAFRRRTGSAPCPSTAIPRRRPCRWRCPGIWQGGEPCGLARF